MELAINFSHPAAELLKAGAIRLDRFKVPDWPELISAASAFLPAYVHFAINIGADDSRTTDWAAAERMARQTATPYVNVHAAARAKDFPGDDAAAILQRLIEDAERAADYFGRERIIIENIPLGNPEENFAPAGASPQVLSELVRRSRCGFLLDLSHARITARHLGLDERQYISALPLREMRELHLTGLQMVEGRLRDHMPMSDEDWIMAEWALGEIRSDRWATPKIVAFEYGGVGGTFGWRTDRDVIARQLPRLYEMIHN